MKIVFISNYYNHHQAALSTAFYALTDGQYTFIQTEEIEQERKDMGWGTEEYPCFVKRAYENKKTREECKDLIWQADVVIAGGSPTVEKYIQKRIKMGKLLFRYSERVYKNVRAKRQMILRGIKYHLCNFPYRNVNMLAASAYAAADYAKTGNFINKVYKWGYFPEVKKYTDVSRLMAEKKPASLLWVARMIDLKHPEVCLEVARRLKEDGMIFSLSLIGNGKLEDTIREKIKQLNLEDCVHLLGVMSPEQVRAHMEKANIFLFTSDFNEGWGAVLNEAMNSGCAVIASHAIGAAPYLIQDGINGYLYKNGDLDDLYQKVKYLLQNPKKAAEFGEKAYEALVSMWNAEVAAGRFIELVQQILSERKISTLFESGPCSKAERLDNNWYQL